MPETVSARFVISDVPDVLVRRPTVLPVQLAGSSSTALAGTFAPASWPTILASIIVHLAFSESTTENVGSAMQSAAPVSPTVLALLVPITF